MAEGTGAAPDLHLLAARDRTDGSTASRLDGVDGDLDWIGLVDGGETMAC